MPFGEELYTGVGGRTGDTGLKYSSNQDDIRQKFTGYQKDKETGLDFAEARMYESRFGRFTAVDPLMSSANPANPQSFNRFAYCLNSPFRYIDKSGMYPTEIHNALIKEAFPGLSEGQIKMIQWGSALVDTSAGTGSWIQFGSRGNNPYVPGYVAFLDFPRTLRPSKAHEHAMIPPGKSREEAIQMADDFIATNINSAIELQNKIDPSGTVISPFALVKFGKAAHTMMDSFSPTHRFFQPYSIPSYKLLGYDTGHPDFGLFIYEGLKHKQGEATISQDDFDKAVTLLRINLLTGLGQEIFEQAVTDQAARDAIYSRVDSSRYPDNRLVPSSFSISRSLSIPTTQEEFDQYRRTRVERTNWSPYQ